MADIVSVPGVRLAYPHLHEPYAFREGDTPKYSALVLIPKDNKDAVKQVTDAIEQCKAEFAAKHHRAFSGRTPMKDGAENAKHPEFADFMTINATTSVKAPPVVVDENCEELSEDSALYPGIGVRVAMRPYSYSVAGNTGISMALNGVMVEDRTTDRLEGGNRLSELGFSPVSPRSPGALI